MDIKSMKRKLPIGVSARIASNCTPLTERGHNCFATISDHQQNRTEKYTLKT